MKTNANIVYSGFYDVPLAFVVTHAGKQFLFLREFDEVVDEYPDTYKVFLLPGIPEDQVKQSWKEIERLTESFLGEVPVNDVEFDPSQRRSINTSVLNRFITTN